MFSSCQQASVDTVNSNKIETSQVYQQYFVSANRGQSTITATFRVGGATGTTIELSAPGKVIYNGVALDKSAPSNLIGTNYRMKGTDYRKTTNSYQANHQFIYTDASNQTFQNAIVLQPLEIAAKSGLTFNRKAASRLPLSRPLAANETISLTIDNATVESIPDQYKTVYLSPERNVIIFTPTFWKNRTSVAESIIEAKVKRNSGVSQGTALGGSITIEYTSAAVSVKFGNTAKIANVNANMAMQNTTDTSSANSQSGNSNSNASVESASNSNSNSAGLKTNRKRPLRTKRKVSSGN